MRSRVADRRYWVVMVALWAILSTLSVSATSILTTSRADALTPAATASVSGSTPKISDTTPKVDQILTAKVGTWKPATTQLSYQWYRGSAPIEGATSATYQVQPIDHNDRLKVWVTGTSEGLLTTVKKSASTSKVGRASFSAKPTPVIDNKAPVVDQQLQADPGAWAPQPDKLSYQWYKVSSKGKTTTLKGATQATYTVVASDKGYRLKVKVSATRAGYWGSSRTSARTAAVVQYKFSDKPTPTIAGTAKPGATLTADAGSWAPNPDRLSLQWKRGGTAIAGATERDYQITDADLGSKLTVTVTAVKAGHATVSTTSSPVTPLGPDSDLRVGSFNISGMNTDGSASGEHEVWSKRMPKVVSQVLGEQLDVLGVQEAYWGTSNPQYVQLRDALNRAGGSYAVADIDKDSSAGNRIIYNTSTVKLLDQGTYQYAAQASGKQTRYFVWATLQDLSSGKKVFFASTHLDPYSDKDTTASTVKVKEWRELIKMIPKLNTGDLPVVTVGDFNTSKWWKEAIELLPAMKSAGFGDVMNQQYQTNPAKGVRAETVENGWINSFNGYRRNVKDYSYSTRHDKVGNGIDWIFASNSLRVKKWKVVVDFDSSTLKVNGVIPSDHNMITSIVVL